MELRPNPDVVWRRLEDEVVVVHLKTNRIYALNTTAARFWELICSGSDVDRVENGLLEEFDVDEQTLRSEVAALVGTLVREGLLTRT